MTTLADEKRILEQIARGGPVGPILDGVSRLLEGASDGVRVSILRLSRDGRTVRHVAAPNLPESYRAVIDGAEVGPSAASCGTAAFRRQRVVVTDIATDPLWEMFRDSALAHGLRACWSMPIFASDESVLGTFGVYALVPRGPSPDELMLLERCSHLTSIAIERSEWTEALLRSEAYRTEAERLSRTGSFTFDFEHQTLSMSDGAREILELERDAALPNQQELLERIHPEDRSRVADVVQRALRDDSDFDYEHRLRSPTTGAVKIVRVMGRTRRDAAGGTEIVGACMDITASRRADDELQRAQAALTRVARVTTLGELTASIAHEVNQPLSAISADARAARNWLTSDPINLPRALESLNAIADDSRRAANVLTRIRGLLARSAMPHRPCRLSEVVDGVMPFVRPELKREGIQLTEVVDRSTPPIMGDPVELQQVLLNLILNAREAMRGVPAERREIVVRSFVSQTPSGDGARGMVHLAVEDQGVGLEMSSIDRIFDAFYSTKEGGLGMGLSISRSIIERHNGRLRARPNLPHGAILELSLEAVE